MKSYPSAYRGKGKLDSPFLESEQWESKYLDETSVPFFEPEDFLPAEDNVDELRYEEEMEDDVPGEEYSERRKLYHELDALESEYNEPEFDEDDEEEAFAEPSIEDELESVLIDEPSEASGTSDELYLDEDESDLSVEYIESVAESVFEDQLSSEFDQEAVIEYAAPPPTVPNIESCNAAKHKHGVMHVVRWKNRYRPCDRRVPSKLTLAILSRARTRIPIRAVKWFIKAKKKENTDLAHWLHRAPFTRFIDSHVDLTIELFYREGGLIKAEITEMLGKYLKLRHGKEKGPLCNRGFFLYKWKTADFVGKDYVERFFGLRKRSLNLDKLYQRAGVKPGSKSRCKGSRADETPDDFLLLCYITLPNSFEHELKPVPPRPSPPRTPREKRMELAKAILEVSKTQLPKDKNSIRRKRMKCMLRLVTGHLVDGDKISDVRLGKRPIGNPNGHFTIDMEMAWRASGGNHEKFWDKLRLVYNSTSAKLNWLKKKHKTDDGGLNPSEWSSQAFVTLCRLRKRSKKSNDIMRCFGKWLEAATSEKGGDSVCP